jgi:GTP-binding protein
MLTDEVKIKILAGRGGDGIVAFDKIKMNLGPTGGRGGNGGSVYFRGVPDIFALKKFKNKKEFWAEDGKKGRGNRSDGPAGKDLILELPLGTVARNSDTEETYEITAVGKDILAAKGGIGGRGNFYFRSPKNTTPEEFEIGKPGEKFKFFLELRLIADVSLIGLPSAGKSSILNDITNANAKVGAYHFTTLEPNLGAMDGIIIADIPGLIEGASAGRGLGHKFLRHIRRTKILVHCISLESDNPTRDYDIIRQELKEFNEALTKKKELILFTKADLADQKKIRQVVDAFRSKDCLTYSIYEETSRAKLKKKIEALLS